MTNNNHFGQDKWLHRSVSALIAFVVSGILITLGVSSVLSVSLSICVTMSIGVLKEVYDSRVGRFDPYDLLADLEGTVLGICFGLLTGNN